MRNLQKQGFTIIEMMMVVAIVALLVSIAIPNIIRVKSSSNHAFAQTTLKSISNALEMYASTSGTYPTTTTQLFVPYPYLADYFTGSLNGYTFTPTLTNYSYQVVATPVVTIQGTTTYMISTGGLFTSF